MRAAGNNVRVRIRCDEILDPVADNLPEGVGEIETVTVTVNGSAPVLLTGMLKSRKRMEQLKKPNNFGENTKA